ncbi:DASS family sodium-coupled anion symporter [Arthrobacter koreensis]|uniref:SLC13 family permease n=1 Tax=Arthrobacter koreensis TaxID=199136 RepID=UPI002DB9CCBF|nr:DASS family sodium-coupled anion symporter [Arthrobacter koreensis]MEB7505502.1 DASS family sodium-coupled anion symporter [Arthrobacter koreensis]
MKGNALASISGAFWNEHHRTVGTLRRMVEPGAAKQDTAGGASGAQGERGSGPTPSPSSAVFRRVCLILGPAVFAFFAFGYQPPGLSFEGAAVLGTVGWMALWWMSESVPLPATALLPIVLFPLFGIERSGEVFSSYSNNIIFLFLGGFLLAAALEKWGLHRRLAIGIIRILGTSAPRLILGFMAATSFLSFFITNTAATMMMLPMAMAVITSVKEVGSEKPEEIRGFEKSLIFGVGYSATIFGMSTILGGTSIPFFISYTKDSLGIEISFAQFAGFAVPFALVFLLLTWFYLVKIRFRVSMKQIPGGRKIIDEEHRSLGRMSFEEKLVTGVGLFVSLLWVTRTWLVSPIVPEITDGMIAVIGAVLLFLLPARKAGTPRLLEWSDTTKVPWGVLLLLGGGFALAGAVQSTGLSQWIGDQFIGLNGVPALVFILIVVLTLAFLTEITSTGATAILFIPLMATVAVAVGQDPLFVMLAAALAVNCSFMLPAGTPPNSIIYASGLVTIGEMIRAGFVITLLGAVLIVATMFTWAPLMFSF